MDIEVHSFRSIQERAEQTFPVGTTLISIGDVGEQSPALLHGPAHILRMEFDDADRRYRPNPYVFSLMMEALDEQKGM